MKRLGGLHVPAWGLGSFIAPQARLVELAGNPPRAPPWPIQPLQWPISCLITGQSIGGEDKGAGHIVGSGLEQRRSKRLHNVRIWDSRQPIKFRLRERTLRPVGSF